jgi:hypothetical protein
MADTTSPIINDPKKHLSTPMGIHRLYREPYDDREVFRNMNDLMIYCKGGARYDGQRVSCIIGKYNESDNDLVEEDDDTYIQNFIIHNGYPIIQFNHGQHYYKFITTDSTNKITDAYLLVYYYNSISGKMYNENKKNHNYLNDGMQYSILDLIQAVNGTTSNNYTFHYETFDPSIDNYDNLPSIQMNTFITGELSVGAPTSEDYAYGLKITNTSNNTTTIDIIPKEKVSIVQRLYVKATEYLKAAGIAIDVSNVDDGISVGVN